MNKRYRDILFFLMCAVLIFIDIPMQIRLNFLGGPVGSKLVVYPLLVGFLYTAWCRWKHGGILVGARRFGSYCALYLAVSLMSLLVGLYTYPYWDLVLSGPMDQIKKMPSMMAFLHSHGIEADSTVLMSVWIVIRQVKGLLLETFWCWGGAYLIYCWYREDWRRGMEIATRALLTSLAIFIGYGVIDALYLYGSPIAESILVAVNPYLHPILWANGWWPPLLWKGQLRSVLSEPSFVGNYLGLAVPFLLYAYFKSRNKLFLIIIAVVTFLVVLTNARTAYAMMAGMLGLGILLTLLLVREYWKQAVAVLIVSVLGFYGGIGFWNYASHANGNVVTAESAIEDNIGSLASGDKRSNGARYALIKCNLRIASENPILGVGSGLAQAYMLEHYTEAEKQNGEVAMWVEQAHQYGVFAEGQGMSSALNEYVTRLAQRGVVGLTVFLLPFVYLLYRLCRLRNRRARLERMAMIFALITSLVAACNGSVAVIYGPYFLLGLGYAMCLSEEEQLDEVKDD